MPARFKYLIHLFGVILIFISSASDSYADAPESHVHFAKHCFIPFARGIAKRSDVIDLVIQQNNIIKTPEQIFHHDSEWRKLDNFPKDLENVVLNEVSLYLQELMRKIPVLEEAFLIDFSGTIIALTHKTTDYWQGDEEQFQYVLRHSPDSVYVSKEHPDESAGAFVQKIAVPVLHQGITVGVLILAINSIVSQLHHDCATMEQLTP